LTIFLWHCIDYLSIWEIIRVECYLIKI